MPHYYNENDAFAAAWLRNLIAAGHIPGGEVDERSIADVDPADVAGFVQCHFFAGIAGWPLALSLAGWPADRPVWTGSCPCQPFSAAGKRQGAADSRHLWPEFYRLIAECRPPIVFGEQVGAAVGRGWLDAVFADLEGEGYAYGAAVLPACGVGAPHIRQRCWFVADAAVSRWNEQPQRSAGANGWPAAEFGRLCDAGRLVDASPPRLPPRECSQLPGPQRFDEGRAAEKSGGSSWAADWLACTDGKARPVEPGTFPLAHGIPGRVGRLRAYGNAIVPQVAAEFIAAAMECRP